jgi:hypothetical protein
MKWQRTKNLNDKIYYVIYILLMSLSFVTKFYDSQFYKIHNPKNWPFDSRVKSQFDSHYTQVLAKTLNKL